MKDHIYILIILLAEIVLFTVEVVLSSFNKKNKVLKEINFSNEVDFINLDKGFRTNNSIFRFSLFIVYIVLVVLYFDNSTVNFVEELVLYILGGILIYMVSLLNAKIFVFYSTHFVISAPFNFFKRELIVNYESIEDFEIYKALYNSYYLKLKLKDSKLLSIQFSGSYSPKNNLALRYILNKKTSLKKIH